MRIFNKYFLCISFLSSSFVIAFSQVDTSAIDSIFIEWNQPDVPGCAMGIIKDGELVFARGYGMANLEYDIPNSPESVYRIGSTSKQFTAACIVLLVEKGKLNFDDTLEKFFPDFPEYARKISVRHLLNHTSGIRDYLMISYLKGLTEDDYYTDSEIMAWLVRQQDLNFLPGDEYLYSNSGYWLLGQIVQQVAGENMSSFAKRVLFDPLDMKNTHFHNDHTMIVRKRASGYMPGDDTGFRISMTTLDMIGDGGIFTTIRDIKKWDDAYYDNSVLSQRFWDMMTDRAVLNNGDTLDYASGLNISTYNGLKTISHGGAFVGFRANLIRFPDQRFSVAIFANRGDANPTGKGFEIADIILKNHFIDRTIELKSSADKLADASHMYLSPGEMSSFEGLYWNAPGAYSRKIYVKNDTLRYSRSETNESDLIPVAHNEFKMIGVTGDVRIKFSVNDNQEKRMYFIANGGSPITSVAYDPVNYSKEQLMPFAGTYYSEELDVDYKVKMKNDQLMLYLEEEEISDLIPVMNHVFTNDRYGVFSFTTNKNGDVKGFKLAAGRVKNLNFEKK